MKCYDFFPECQGSSAYAKQSALILEKGDEDLRDYLMRLQHQERGSDPTKKLGAKLDSAQVQASLLAAAKCLETIHSKNLVYTDLKAENLIFMERQQPSGAQGKYTYMIEMARWQVGGSLTTFLFVFLSLHLSFLYFRLSFPKPMVNILKFELLRLLRVSI